VDSIIAEPIMTHQKGAAKNEIKDRVEELLQVVGLHPFHALRYPH